MDQPMASLRTPSPRRQNAPKTTSTRTFVLLSLLSTTSVMAQDSCISLQGSTACPAFSSASISTSPQVANVVAPFVQFVSDREQFDSELFNYIATDYARQKYQQLIGCSDVNLTDTSNLYARYTASVICNALVQNSISACGDTARPPTPLCADSCAEFAISEQEITGSAELCGTTGPNALDQIRADFTNCALPADSLRGNCIPAYENEPDECGYHGNLPALCGFCAQSSTNATDSCCVNADAEGRCAGVDIPTFTSMPAPWLTETSSSSAPTATGDSAGSTSPSDQPGGLTAGQIAGIVVGSVLGAILILALVIFGCLLMRRRRQSQAGSIFNQPSPARQGSDREMTYADGARSSDLIPSRVARMAALEDGSSSSLNSPIVGYRSSPTHDRMAAAGGLPRRTGSLSSGSALNLMEDPSSPQTSSGIGEQFSSPEGVTSGQSEQLSSFKDYYSQDDIHPGDSVATLWAYQPRANDEFELERGDMLKIVGIWDDGWATGVKLSENADEWERRRQEQRDSGVSNAHGKSPSPIPVNGEIKAFPLVCVCLPQHWRKTIEGDTATSASQGIGQRSGGNTPPRSSP